MKKQSELDEMLKCQIINKLLNTSSTNTITSKTLCSEINISFRELKRLITELRNEYPIVSRETNGGGYWIDKTNSEIQAFIKMIDARKIGYENTINTMNKFIKE